MRLKAIADDLAATMQISHNVNKSGGPNFWPILSEAKNNPISANGRANTECENFIILPAEIILLIICPNHLAIYRGYQV